MIDLGNYINDTSSFPTITNVDPWQLTAQAKESVAEAISKLGGDFFINNSVAIHRSATIEQGVVLKGPVIISANCFVAAHAYLRGGVFLAEQVSIGPGC